MHTNEEQETEGRGQGNLVTRVQIESKSDQGPGLRERWKAQPVGDLRGDHNLL